MLGGHGSAGAPHLSGHVGVGQQGCGADAVDLYAVLAKRPAARGGHDGKHKGDAIHHHLQAGGQTGHRGQLLHQVLWATGRQAPAVAVVIGADGGIEQLHLFHAGQQLRFEGVNLHIDP